MWMIDLCDETPKVGCFSSVDLSRETIEPRNIASPVMPKPEITGTVIGQEIADKSSCEEHEQVVKTRTARLH